jgi:hypothetical protein
MTHLTPKFGNAVVSSESRVMVCHFTAERCGVLECVYPTG